MRVLANAIDIQNLIVNVVREDRTIEYKIGLPGAAREDNVEFLSDVTSFSNTSGGQILYGIRAEEGVPVEAQAIENLQLDQAILRLENLIRDSVQPRLVGAQFVAVPITQNHSVLVLNIPKSFAAPHVVSNQGHWRFYGRNSAGKYPLDVHELRTAINLSDNVGERLRQFRAQRLLDMKSGNTPVVLQENGLLVLHLLPLNTNSQNQEANLTRVLADPVMLDRNLAPIYGAVVSQRFNLDGYLTASPANNPPANAGYLQIFRTGAIETVDSTLMAVRGDRRDLPSLLYEEVLRQQVPLYLQAMRLAEVQLPIACMVSFLNAKDYALGLSQRMEFNMRHFQINRLDRDDLVIPEFIIEDFDLPVDQILRPIFDSIWNSFGFSRSLNYDERGEWRPLQ